MALSPIPFSGMASLEADELVPLQEALIAENCYLDDDTIRARNGYRALTPAALAGSGQTQGLWRFRPSASDARTVAAVAGTIYTVTDPSGETTTGTAATIGTPFGSGANVSAAQLGRYLYLAADDGSAMRRMDSSYALATLSALPKGTQPTYSLSSLAVVKFNSLAAGTLTNATSSTIDTDYYQIAPTASGGGVVYDLGADQVWTGDNWLMVIVSPSTQGGGGGTITISLSTSSGTFERIGEISDSLGDDAPCVVYCPLTSLTAATRAAVRKIQLVNSTNTNAFICHGIMPIPSAPGVGPQEYNLTFQNSTTLQESIPTDNLTITYANNTITIPQFHAVVGHYNGWADKGKMSADPDAMPQGMCYNKGAGLDLPSKYELAAIPTFSGSIPSGDQYPSADTVRLWRLTQTGWRLVKSVTYSTGVTSYTITDDTGLDTLTHDLYIAGGTAPAMTCLTARAQRLVGANGPTIYISSYVPTAAADSVGVYPQFPAIPIDDSSGWYFDIAASNAEQIQWLGNGDALYILSNEAAYSMSDLTPNSPPFKIFERGALGRRAACWAEQQLFFASHDGVYAVLNRSQVEELSQGIRRQYMTWLAPDSTTVVAYQARKLYVFCNGKYLRYDFVRQRWTRGTVANTFLHAAGWRDPSGTIQNMWFLDANRKIQRWQPSDVVGSTNVALDDNGAAIAPWQYWTGFEFTPTKARIRSIFLDTTGPVTLSVHTSMEDLDGRVKEFRKPEHQEPFAADLTAYKFRIQLVGLGGAQVKRLLWERLPVSGEGA